MKINFVINATNDKRIPTEPFARSQIEKWDQGGQKLRALNTFRADGTRDRFLGSHAERITVEPARAN